MVEMAELPWLTPAGGVRTEELPPGGESRAVGAVGTARPPSTEPLEVVQGTDPWAGCAAFCVCVRVRGCVGV